MCSIIYHCIDQFIIVNTYIEVQNLVTMYKINASLKLNLASPEILHIWVHFL